MEIIIFDTEYTTWEGAQERKWLGANEYKEIIQIGALKVLWPEAQVIEDLCLTVKPKKNPILSRYCIDLTGISQEVLNTHGIEFQRALKIFCDFCGNRPVISYGNDAGIIAENIILSRADPLSFYGRSSLSFINIKYWILAYNENLSKLTSGELWQKLGCNKPKNFKHKHYSLSDCYSILQAVKHLQENGSRLPF
jgi:hypothetical protein